MENICLIPARSGSKGVPGKNKRVFAGKPLISYSIEVAVEARVFDKIIVSTDDPDIQALSKKYDVLIQTRDASLAQDDSLISDVARDCLEQVSANASDNLTLLQVTSPIRDPEDIRASVKNFISSKCESLISVVPVSDNHPARMYGLTQDGFLIPQVKSLESAPRQTLPAAYLRNGAIYITKCNNIYLGKGFFSKPCLPYVMKEDRLLNIDSTRDAIIADSLLSAWKNGEL